nr:transposase [Sphingopyxis sp.]
MSDLFWLPDEQMARLQPYFLKSHSRECVDDRRVLSGIIFVNRNGRRWRDAPREYGPAKPVRSLSKESSTTTESGGATRALHSEMDGCSATLILDQLR